MSELQLKINSKKVLKQLESPCFESFKGFFICSNKPELKKYFLAPVDVCSGFEVTEDVTEIIGVKDITLEVGKTYYDVIISYYDKKSESFNKKACFVLQDDIVCFEEKDAIRKFFFENKFDDFILKKRQSL